jgi:hypothetical protein
MSTNKLISYLSLLSGLSLSGVAIYYSVSGLISIFTGAIIPIMIMGSVLEISKLIATVWLKQYWNIATTFIKVYLILAIFILMIITSLGVYGFLSRASLESTVSSGDIEDKLYVLNEKIKIQEDIITDARKALVQLDSAVDQTMGRSTNENGALKSIRIRQSQQRERDELRKSIDNSQKVITVLKEERTPLSNQARKASVEHGPIVYISALLYDDSQKNMDNAIRYVIILIVIVFDPLAVILLLCSQYSFKYIEDNKNMVLTKTEDNPEIINSSIVDVNINNSIEPVLNSTIVDDIITEVIVQNPDIVPEDVDDNLQEDIIEDSHIIEEDDDMIDENEYNEKSAKARWKAEDTTNIIKHQEKLLNLGLIDKLPWEK